MTANEMITLYNRMTQRLCGQRGTYPLPHSRNMLKAAGDFLAWASSHEINAKHWVIARHDAIKWSRRIPLKDLKLARESAFRQQYEEWIANKLASLDQEVEDRAKPEADTNKVTSTTILGEASKAAFADSPEVCLASSESLTGGWHPKSKWCGQCGLRKACRARLKSSVARRRQNARC